MRSKLLILAACLAALSMFTGCYFNWAGVRGSGIVKTESKEITTFSSIAFKAVGKLKIQQTGKESLTISADDNILPLLESRVADNVLYLSTAKDASTRLSPLSLLWRSKAWRT